MGRRYECEVFSNHHFKIFGYNFGYQIAFYLCVYKFGCQFETFGNLQPRR